MMETARYLPSSDSRSVKLAVHGCLLADRLCALCGRDGAFPRLPATSLPDTEAGAILTVFVWDIYQKTENKPYLDCVKRAMENLRKCTRKNGLVDFAQPESRARVFIGKGRFLLLEPLQRRFMLLSKRFKQRRKSWMER